MHALRAIFHRAARTAARPGAQPEAPSASWRQVRGAGRILAALICAGLAAVGAAGVAGAAPQSSMAGRELRPEYVPAWASAPVAREVALDFDPALTEVANGARLRSAVAALQPGDRLTIGAGVWSVSSLFTVTLTGTAQAPIRIEARAGATPVLTRPDAGQNLINFGDAASTPRFLLLRGFELRGGSIGVRIERADDLWLDELHVHHTGAACVRASNHDTARLYVTRCELSHSSQVNGTGEGLYIGANSAAAVSRDAVVALNHVHDTGGTQGDGIELKQGSFGCLIAENVVHDTLYPGILVYGSGGGARNVIEGNVIWATVANPFQVQGEALVRNNVVFGGANAAFVSFDHQGQVRDLEVVHNTFVTTTGDAARLQHWGGRPGMVLANNALYSQAGRSLNFLSGAAGVTLAGNVVFGPTWNDGGAVHTSANGASDFVDVAFDGARRDAHPTLGGALFGAAAAPFVSPSDATGAARVSAAVGAPASSGALEPGTYGRYVRASIAGAAGAPRLRSSGSPSLGGGPVSLTLEGGRPGNFAVVGVQLVTAAGAPLPGAPAIQRTVLVLDAQGRAAFVWTPPPSPGPAFGAAFGRVSALARDATAPGGVAATQWIEWRL
ncbi:MAG: right-handed parallel beta-helix repeat-containing protein [Planctomycetota bacterium]